MINPYILILNRKLNRNENKKPMLSINYCPDLERVGALLERLEAIEIKVRNKARLNFTDICH